MPDMKRETQQLGQIRAPMNLGSEKNEGIQYLQMEERLKKIQWKIKNDINSKLNTKNKITANGASAVPILKQSFSLNY
jgi:hypothetical protein